MKAEEFVDKLKLIPSKERVEFLKEKGLPNDFIEEYLQSYFFKDGPKNLPDDDPIITLVSNYDGETVKIGMITFDIDPEEDLEYYYFAQFEADLLAINKNSKTIEMVEYGTDRHVLSKCALNSSKFLDAILEAAIFMEKCAYDDDLYNDEKLKSEIAEECAKLAGSKTEYQDFYKILLGCDY